MNWKKIGTNVLGVAIGTAAIIHELPPAWTTSAHVPKVLAVIATLLGLFQRPPHK